MPWQKNADPFVLCQFYCPYLFILCSFFPFFFLFFLAFFMQVDDITMIFFWLFCLRSVKFHESPLFSLFMQDRGGNKKLYLLFKRERFSPTGNECAGYYLVFFSSFFFFLVGTYTGMSWLTV